MALRRSRSQASPELSERQRYWLKHIRTAERKREPLKHYAKRLGLSEQYKPNHHVHSNFPN